MRRRLTLEMRVSSPDGMGGFSVAWVALGQLWADMAARSGREAVTGGREVSRQSWRITVRGAPPGAASRPRPDQRFREGARVFDIRSVAEADPAGRYLICLAEEGLST